MLWPKWLSANRVEQKLQRPRTAVRSAEQSNTSADADTVAFSGENFTAEYIKSYEQSGISGCFYVTVDISNTNDKECTYLLEDVYVDNSHCTSGSGLPVTALPGKSVKGVFIVFCDTKLSNVSQIEFCLSVMDSGTMAQIEKSQSISVSLIG